MGGKLGIRIFCVCSQVQTKSIYVIFPLNHQQMLNVEIINLSVLPTLRLNRVQHPLVQYLVNLTDFSKNPKHRFKKISHIFKFHTKFSSLIHKNECDGDIGRMKLKEGSPQPIHLSKVNQPQTQEPLW